MVENPSLPPAVAVTCPLCAATGPFAAVRDMRKRTLQACPACRLVFARPGDWPAPAVEKERYVAHRNGPDDAGYVTFLRQAVAPALPLLPPGARGLDYGCGHTPTLHLLLQQAGFTCANYDPFFFPDWPRETFDFIFATEVVEHFHRPASEWPKLLTLLPPAGLLIVMTAPWDELTDFRAWGYASDETHVVFYHRATFAWIKARWGLVEIPNPNPRVRLWRRR